MIATATAVNPQGANLLLFLGAAWQGSGRGLRALKPGETSFPREPGEGTRGRNSFLLSALGPAPLGPQRANHRCVIVIATAAETGRLGSTSLPALRGGEGRAVKGEGARAQVGRSPSPSSPSPLDGRQPGRGDERKKS